MTDFTEEARKLLFGSKLNETTQKVIANRIAAALQAAYERGSADQLKRCENILMGQLLKAIRNQP